MVKHNLYTKIFRQLRGYFMSPHLNLWRGLRKRLFSKNLPDKISQLKDYKEEPPQELFQQVIETHEQLNSTFSQLKDLQEEPGEILFDNIVSLIKKEAQHTQPGIIRTIPFYKKIAAAAALLILLISCFFILNTRNNPYEQYPHMVNSEIPVLKDSVFQPDSITGSQPGETSVTVIHTKRMNATRYFDATNYLSFPDVNVGDTKMNIEANDILYSFTKYPYRFGQPNPWNEHNSTELKINSFTSISISPYMSSVISDLYKVKRNGKASPKARKAKAKINRWRKTDVKRFDKRKIKNPLDIIDLGENVF